MPLPNPEFSPKAVPVDYYYRIPVRKIYRGYPVYAPGREPQGYFEDLQRREPEVVWDDGAIQPRLETKADCVRSEDIRSDCPCRTRTTGADRVPEDALIPPRHGRWIYFSSTRAGVIPGIWRVTPDGGQAIRMTRNVGFEPKESPEGRYLFYLDRHPGACRSAGRPG